MTAGWTLREMTHGADLSTDGFLPLVEDSIELVLSLECENEVIRHNLATVLVHAVYATRTALNHVI